MNNSNNIQWIDALRIFACFFVVLAHSCDHFVACFNSDYTTFLQGCAIGSMVRFCVPIFVMITGVLLFPINTNMPTFYKKRIGRLIIPLIAWSIITPLIYYFYLQFITTNSPNINMEMYTVKQTITKITTFIFNFNYDTTPLWYLYMLIGLYIIMPIINSWLATASQKDVKLFLKIWVISLFIPYLKILAPLVGYIGNWENMDILGVCDWNAYGTFYYISGFIGYLVLAQYLVKYPLSWSLKKRFAVGVPIFLVGYAITFFGFITMQEYFPGNYAYLEIVWLFAGINVFMLTLPVFLIFQKINFKPSPIVSKIAKATFGIYLSHFVFVQMMYDFYSNLFNNSVPAIIKIICIGVSSFIISYIIVKILLSIKYIRKIVQ